MTKKTWEDFLVAFSKANKFVFPNTTAMQQAAEEMWNDLRMRPLELEQFIKETENGERGRTSPWRNTHSLCFTFWESTGIQHKLDMLLISLQKSEQGKLFQGQNAFTLSQVAIELLVFQEKNYGRGCQERLQGMMIPTQFFYDFEPEGGFAKIISQVRLYCLKESLKDGELELDKKEHTDRGHQVFKMIRRSLKNRQMKHIYLSKEFGESKRAQLRTMAESAGARVVDEKDTATHLIYPGQVSKPDHEHCTPLREWNTYTYVHWWYSPPSYNTWIGSDQLPVGGQTYGDVKNEKSKWKISDQWLEQSFIFNEWMLEWDYQLNNRGEVYTVKTQPNFVAVKPTESGEKNRKRKNESPVPEAKSKKRPGAAEKPRGKKRSQDVDLTKGMENPDPKPEITRVDMPPIPLNAQPSVNIPPSTNRNLRNIQLADLDHMADEIPDDIAENPDQVAEQTHHIIVPSYSAWFDYNAIHAIEKRALPEFFNNKNKSKTPEVYMAYRNFMIDTYRLNPMEYLSATACRRNLAGDVCAIMRSHAFLEQWGLVNYQVDADSRPAQLGPPPTSHFHVLADTPSGIQPVEAPKVKKSSTEVCDPSVTAGDADIKAEVANNFGLKTDQYSEKTKKVGKSASKPWTEQETLLLLEALEMYRDDWNKVAEHVGTRTQDECIMNFLKLPIEDPYLDGKQLAGIDGNYDFMPIPFSQSGNPVMTTVAFLASAVDPQVAAEAARAAITEFTKQQYDVPNHLKQVHVDQVMKHKQDTGKSNPEFGLDKSGIAGYPKADDEEEKTSTEDKEKDDDMEVDKPKETDDKEPKSSEKDDKLSDEELKKAAAVALAAAAVKAKHLATQEERKIRSLVAVLVDFQLKKMDLKMKQLDELETMLEKERETIENQRRQLIAERQQFHMEQIKSIEAARARDQNMREERTPNAQQQQATNPQSNRSFPPSQYQATGGQPQQFPPQQQQQQQQTNNQVTNSAPPPSNASATTPSSTPSSAPTQQQSAPAPTPQQPSTPSIAAPITSAPEPMQN